ncbi:MAG: hypothetical protein MJZ31_01245 [Bacteroidales bacterium]|nr:hypothetical protein [Bacteroidales bacterium]
MKNSIYLLFALTLILCLDVNAQSHKDTLLFVSYNVENFFHPSDDPERNDDDFTDKGEYMWTMDRAIRKAEKIARVINHISSTSKAPAVVGFCEIEGLDALNLLMDYGRMSQRGYRAVNLEYEDGRGIATMMIYRPDQLTLIDSALVNCSIPEKDFNTRTILHCTFTHGNDTIHVMENHWPSKYGGATESIWRRVHVANVLKSYCDSILSVSPNANIVLMGDFNENAKSEEIHDVLGATAHGPVLYNLSGNDPNRNSSYKYRERWNTIDHIIVTKNLFNKADPKFEVIAPNFLLEQDFYNNSYKPYRTYVGRKYNDGYSDHLPVKLTITL